MGDLLAAAGNPVERRGFNTKLSTNFNSSPLLGEIQIAGQFMFSKCWFLVQTIYCNERSNLFLSEPASCLTSLLVLNISRRFLNCACLHQ